MTEWACCTRFPFQFPISLHITNGYGNEFGSEIKAMKTGTRTKTNISSWLVKLAYWEFNCGNNLLNRYKPNHDMCDDWFEGYFMFQFRD